MNKLSPIAATASGHPSLAAPKCIDCTHVVRMDSRIPTCAHPQAERDLVDGRTARSCNWERNATRSYCGPSGNGFEPKTLAGATC